MTFVVKGEFVVCTNSFLHCGESLRFDVLYQPINLGLHFEQGFMIRGRPFQRLFASSSPVGVTTIPLVGFTSRLLIVVIFLIWIILLTSFWVRNARL